MLKLLSGIMFCAFAMSQTASAQQLIAPLEDGRRVTLDRDLALVQMAWYGDSKTFEDTLRRIATNTDSFKFLYGVEKFPFTTQTRGIGNVPLTAVSGDRCPLHMHVFYSFMTAPEGSRRLQDAAEKMAFMLNPHKRLLAREEAEQAAQRDAWKPEISREDANKAIEALDFIKNLKRQKDPDYDAKQQAEKAAAEERRQDWLMNPWKSPAFNKVVAYTDVGCDFQNNTSVPGYPFEAEWSTLYGQLARASLDDRTSDRASAMMDVMRSMGEFDQDLFNRRVDQYVTQQAEERARTIRAQQTIAAREKAKADALAEEERIYREAQKRKNPNWGNKNAQLQQSLRDLQSGLAVTVGRLNEGSSSYSGYNEGLYTGTKSGATNSNVQSGASNTSQTRSGNSGSSDVCEGFDRIAFAEAYGQACLAAHPCVRGNSSSSGSAPGAICN